MYSKLDKYSTVVKSTGFGSYIMAVVQGLSCHLLTSHAVLLPHGDNTTQGGCEEEVKLSM